MSELRLANDTKLSVANLGIDSFLDPLRESKSTFRHLDWRPSARGDAKIGWELARLLADPRVEPANKTALERLLTTQPVLTGVATAAERIPILREGRVLLHAGPPLTWERASGPVRGALIGAVLWEGWESDPAKAEAALAKGGIALDSCHHHGAVGPMAGIVSPSMPLWVVSDGKSSRTVYSNMNEGLGKVLRFGANSAEVLSRLSWMRDELGPALDTAFSKRGPLELLPLMSRALHMGDELHNRNVAATGLFYKVLVPALLDCGLPQAVVLRVLAFVAANDHFFLNLSMASAKLMCDAASGVPFSTMVCAMARNGTDFGIKTSALPDRWFTAQAPVVEGLFFAPYGVDDAAADLGDSAITETAGLGGFCLAAAPAIVQFVGGSAASALELSREMYGISIGKHVSLSIPALDFDGAPVGIDMRRVVDANVAPVINTGIAHKEPGIGQIGAGISRAPLACFEAAISAHAEAFL